MKIFIQWLKTNSVLLVNASSLIGTTAITSGLGFVYWWIVARWFSPEAVGIASASVSAMMLISGACVLGLGTLLITELPRHPEQAGSMISTALLVVGSIGTVAGFLFALLASYISPGFQPLRASFIDALTFSLGIGFATVTLVLDQALIGLLKGGLQLWRNAFFAVIKLVAIFVVGFWPSNQIGMKIYATWMVSSVLSLCIIILNISLKPNWRSKNYFPQLYLLRKLGLSALQHHTLNLTLQAPTLLLPILVTVLLSARMNAWFYVSWMIVSFVFIFPGALTTVLHAMNSAQQSTLGRKARLTISVALIISLLANAVLLLFTKQVLGLFGSTYAAQATWSLRILVLAAFPLIIKNHYISLCRIQDRIMKAMVGMLPGGLLELGAAAFGAHVGGLLGLSLGWVIAIYIEAICMLPTVYHVVRFVQVSQQDEIYEVYQQDTVPLMAAIGGSYIGNDPIWLLETSLIPALRLTCTGETPVVRKPLALKGDRVGRLKPPKLQRYVSSSDDLLPDGRTLYCESKSLVGD